MDNNTKSAVMTAETEVNTKNSKLSKGCAKTKRAVRFVTTMCVLATVFAMPASAATGVVNTSSFITTACTVLKSVICLIGGGVGVWGIVNLLEGYGNDNPGAKRP